MQMLHVDGVLPDRPLGIPVVISAFGPVGAKVAHEFATGTPQGVGYVRNPPWLLGPGDIVEVDIERLGVLRTPIVGPADRTESGAS